MYTAAAHIQYVLWNDNECNRLCLLSNFNDIQRQPELLSDMSEELCGDLSVKIHSLGNHAQSSIKLGTN